MTSVPTGLAAVLTAVALGILVAKTIPAVTAHRGQIHATSHNVATCTIHAERPGDSRTQTLTHLADCLQDNHQIRTGAGDITLTIDSLAFVGASG